MKKQAIIDRFEGDFIVLECKNGSYINIPKKNAPAMAAEGMVVWYEDDKILSIDEIETARQEYDLRVRFERILGKNKPD